MIGTANSPVCNIDPPAVLSEGPLNFRFELAWPVIGFFISIVRDLVRFSSTCQLYIYRARLSEVFIYMPSLTDISIDDT